MADTYDVLVADGSVLQYRRDQFSELAEARSREERQRLVADGWMPLDERIELGEAPPPKIRLAFGKGGFGSAPRFVLGSAEPALGDAVTPPDPPPSVTVYILGRLKPGEEGVKVV
jgi:hypothetical protein